MKNLIAVVGLLVGAAMPSRAALYYASETSASSHTLRVAGVVRINNPATPYAQSIVLDGRAGTGTFLYGVGAATGAFTATGATQYSVTTSSGISVAAGMVVAPGGLNGPLYGSGANITAATIPNAALVANTVTSAKMSNTISANSCGSATAVPVITYDAAGRLSACTPTTISGATQWTTSGSNIQYLTNGGIVQIGKYSGLGAKLHVGGSSLDSAAHSLAMVNISTQSSGYPGLTSVLALRISNNAGSAGTRTNILLSGNDETNLKAPSSFYAGTWLSNMEGRADVAGRNFAQSFDIAVATGYRPGFSFTHVGLGTGDPNTAVGGPVFEIGYDYFDNEAAATHKANPGPAQASLGVFQSLNSPAYAVVVSSQNSTALLSVHNNGATVVGSGTLAVSGSITTGSATPGSGTQLYYCAGGTFAGNVVRGAGGVCTGGTATAIGIWVP